MDDVPKTSIPASEFDGDGLNIINLMTKTSLVPSRSEGIRTIEQGGLSIDNVKVTDPKLMITLPMFSEGKLLLKKGKKTFHMVELG
jgi:tyrosyl-tRNA synthetase